MQILLLSPYISLFWQKCLLLVLQFKTMLSNYLTIPLIGIGVMEAVIILIAILLIFGGRKIPELMRGLGKGVKEFNDARDGKNSGEIDDKRR